MEYPYKWASSARYDFISFIGKVYLSKDGEYTVVGENKVMILPFKLGEKLRLHELSQEK